MIDTAQVFQLASSSTSYVCAARLLRSHAFEQDKNAWSLTNRLIFNPPLKYRLLSHPSWVRNSTEHIYSIYIPLNTYSTCNIFIWNMHVKSIVQKKPEIFLIQFENWTHNHFFIHTSYSNITLCGSWTRQEDNFIMVHRERLQSNWNQINYVLNN